jgi:hypothetical protein
MEATSAALKPEIFTASDGTAEAVPFPILAQAAAAGSRALSKQSRPFRANVSASKLIAGDLQAAEIA